MIKLYFESLYKEIHEDALKRFPGECCGYITEDKYIACENTAEEPEKDFEIESRIIWGCKTEVQAIIHSHNNFPHASKIDMMNQEFTAIPWGIVNVKDEVVTDTFFFGDKLEIQELEGRPFYHGVYDCYSLVRDYYRMKGDVLPIIPREYIWWERGGNLLENFYREVGFEDVHIRDIQVGDVVLMSILSPTNVINHSGIYLGNNTLLHHLLNRLSRSEPLSRWRDYIVKIVRRVK